jgi:peptide/nickel transport system ATP-binding protein
MSPLLDMRDLRVHFPTEDGVVKAVDGLSLQLERGRRLGIVGESGSGKSAAALAIMGLHQPSTARISGEIWLDGTELVSAETEQVRKLRGRNMAMIFQDPLSALHPYYTVRHQIGEAYRLHYDVSKQAAYQHAVDLLDRVGIPRARSRVDDYPHQFSGGMRQRVMIAMALSCNPDLLIADEPTTALDVTVQAQILDLIRDLPAAVLMISHDLGVVAELADDILVMYAGRPVEAGSAADVFAAPQHPYTWGLLGSMPRWNRARSHRLAPIPGSPPSLINPPSGCPFHPRCGYAELTGSQASSVRPELRSAGSPEHLVACHLPDSLRSQILVDEIRPML